MLAVATSLATDGDFTVPCEFGIQGSGGQCYSHFYPLQSILAAPLVVLGQLAAASTGASSEFVGEFAAQAVPALAGAGVATFTAFFALRFGATGRRALLAGATVLLATELAVYFRTFFAEALSALLVCVVVWGHLQAGRSRLVAPVAAGLLVLAKPQLAPVPIAVALVFALTERRARPLVETTAGMLLGAAIYAVYNVIRFGDPLDLGGDARTLRTEAFAPFEAIEAGALLLVSPGRGFLLYSPIVLLGFYAAWRTRRTPLAMTAFAIFGAILLVHVGNPGGGLNWGSRYLVPALPLLVAAAFGALRGRVATGFALALSLLGLLIAAPTFVGNYQRAYAESNEAGVPATQTYWSWHRNAGISVWGAAGGQVEDALETDVRVLVDEQDEPVAQGGPPRVSDQRFFQVVALWWWMTPIAGVPRWFSGLLALLVLLAGAYLTATASPRTASLRGDRAPRTPTAPAARATGAVDRRGLDPPPT